MKTFKCPECGAKLQRRRESVQFDELIPVELLDIDYEYCTACDYGQEVLPRPNPLMRAIVRELAHSSQRLAPGDIRFIREFLGLTGEQFAQLAGVTPVTVSYWENGKKRPSGPADRFFRLIAVGKDVKPAKLMAIDGEHMRSGRLVFRFDGERWLRVNEQEAAA